MRATLAALVLLFVSDAQAGEAVLGSVLHVSIERAGDGVAFFRTDAMPAVALLPGGQGVRFERALVSTPTPQGYDQGNTCFPTVAVVGTALGSGVLHRSGEVWRGSVPLEGLHHIVHPGFGVATVLLPGRAAVEALHPSRSTPGEGTGRAAFSLSLEPWTLGSVEVTGTIDGAITRRTVTGGSASTSTGGLQWLNLVSPMHIHFAHTRLVAPVRKPGGQSTLAFLARMRVAIPEPGLLAAHASVIAILIALGRSRRRN